MRPVGVHEGRVVLLSRVEQVARPGLDRPWPCRADRGGPDRARPGDQDRRILVRVECPSIQGDRDALIAFVGQKIDCVEQAVVSQAVGIVAESHESLPAEAWSSRSQSGSMPSSRSFAA